MDKGKNFRVVLSALSNLFILQEDDFCTIKYRKRPCEQNKLPHGNCFFKNYFSPSKFEKITQKNRRSYFDFEFFSLLLLKNLVVFNT